MSAPLPLHPSLSLSPSNSRYDGRSALHWAARNGTARTKCTTVHQRFVRNNGMGSIVAASNSSAQLVSAPAKIYSWQAFAFVLTSNCINPHASTEPVRITGHLAVVKWLVEEQHCDPNVQVTVYIYIDTPEYKKRMAVHLNRACVKRDSFLVGMQTFF